MQMSSVAGARAARWCSISILIAASASAHPIYQRSVGLPPGPEVAYDVDVAGGDEGTCTVGRTAVASTAQDDILVGRYRPDGSTLWHRQILVTGQREVGYTIHETRDGGFIVGAESDISVPPTTSIILMKLNAAGNTTWAFRYGGSPFLDFPAGVSVREGPNDTTGNPTYVAVGRRAAQATRGVFLRVNSAGGPIVMRNYGYLTATGAPAPLSFADVRAQGNTFVVCGFVDERQFGGNVMPLIMRLDLNGNILLARTYVDAATATDYTADGLTIDGSGDIVISGRSGFVAPNRSLLVARFDAGGNPLWARRTRAIVNGFQAIQGTHNRKFVIAGTIEGINDPTAQDATLSVFDPGGAQIFHRRYGSQGSEEGHGVCVFDCGHGFNLAGLSRLPAAPGQADEYLIRTVVTGTSGCFETPYDSVQNVQLVPRQPNIQSAAQTEFTNFAHQNVPLTVLNVIHCLGATCPADVDDGSDTGKPDEGVDINDLLHFLALFQNGDICADLDDDGVDPANPDGGVDINDLLFFLAHFEAGC